MDPDYDPNPPDAAIDALLQLQGRVAGDVIQLGSETWAIHGTIPVDGEVIVAEFREPGEARAALDRFGA
jgi:hypothetical protein